VRPGLGRHLLKRLGFAALMLVGVSVVLFTLMRLAPGGPEAVLVGGEFSQEAAAQIRQRLGLDRPLVLQYGSWALAALRGDLGRSFKTGDPVATLIGDRLGATVQLTGGALGFALAVAVPLGVLAAVRRDTAWDTLGSAVSLFGVSFPSFWLGIMLILLLSVRLHWLPASGFVPIWENPLSNLERMVMPAFVLGAGLAAVLMRQTRNSMIEILGADYIRTAWSKGLAGRAVIFRHAFRNGLIPVVTILGLQTGALMGGAVVTEQIFVVPGFGRLIVEAVFTRDYPLVQGVVLITASTYVLVNLLVDLSYSVLNPRIRIGGAAGGG
jgi:peptide/nickel transport system permease protein